MKYLSLAFSSVNWCKIDIFTSNIMVLDHEMSQTVKIKVNRYIYWWIYSKSINLYSFFPVFQLYFLSYKKIVFNHLVFLLLLIAWDFLWCKAIIFKVITSNLHQFTELKASGRYFIQDRISYGRLFIASGTTDKNFRWLTVFKNDGKIK